MRSCNDRALVERGLVNYWGYNTLAFFAPEPRYLSDGIRDELKRAIKALHAAGIEVLLDVVYNHTGEGSELGTHAEPARSRQRGLLPPRRPTIRACCVNDTGTGNTVNFSHPRVIAADARFAALLGAGISRRRFSLRPERHARARSTTASIPARASSMR